MKDKSVLVVGTGISGISALEALNKIGAKLYLYEGNTDKTPEEIQKKVPTDIKTTILIGSIDKEILKNLDFAIISPGVPINSEIVLHLKANNIKVIGELELGFLLGKGDIIAITGTNGKTTTTTLVGEIMKAYSKEVYVVGNIGNPYALEAMKMSQEAISVAEISSFQLESIDKFTAKISAILNLTPDHLDRHGTMEQYAREKEKITNNQKDKDICVLNYDNSYTREFGDNRCPSKVIYFSSTNKLSNGYYLEDGTIFYANKNEVKPLMNIVTDMNLVGVCNVENVMAAIAMTYAYGVPMEIILKVIKEFKAVEHRIEFVANKGDVLYYNDSKATNPDAAIQGIKAMDRPTILIAGGYDKKNSYEEWINAFDGKVKKMILIGQTANQIAECAKKCGFYDFEFAEDFNKCMELCQKYADKGDSVLLSPACASWGMFPNYEVRGKMFKDFVNKL